MSGEARAGVTRARASSGVEGNSMQEVREAAHHVQASVGR